MDDFFVILGVIGLVIVLWLWAVWTRRAGRARQADNPLVMTEALMAKSLHSVDELDSNVLRWRKRLGDLEKAVLYHVEHKQAIPEELSRQVMEATEVISSVTNSAAFINVKKTIEEANGKRVQ